MKKIGTTAALCAATLALGGLTGCDSRSGSGSDAGGIVLMDSGGGGGTDAGSMMGTDSGPPATGCSVAGATGFPPLPAACLPRCSSATASALMACGMDATCQSNALRADTTAPTNVDFGGGMSESINCFGCFNWMINACIFDSCPSQFGACIECSDFCDDATAGCEAEETALNTCIDANISALQTCANSRASMCFATGGGFLPDFNRPDFQLSPERLRRVIAELDLPLPL
ncbi:MAG: hypothetical protein KF729_06955 [Sandaracinaceae bacterium]|nr:hypothetical protein [Sandaracinaceae bacterium]